jgi:putative ABC transport system permease protein
MDQLSYRFLHEEFRQLATMTRVFPTIFLGVAAFLLNVVFTRLVGTQRDQVAILKAFGYSTLDVALHYGLIVTLICLIGSALGVAGGAAGHADVGDVPDVLPLSLPGFQRVCWWLLTGIGPARVAAAAPGALFAAPTRLWSRPCARPRRIVSDATGRAPLPALAVAVTRIIFRQIERRPSRR